MVEKSFHDNYGGGTLNLVRHLAFKYPCPNIEQRTHYYGTWGLYYASTQYIWMHISQDGIDDVVVTVGKGLLLSLSWSNCRGATFDTMRANLQFPSLSETAGYLFNDLV